MQVFDEVTKKLVDIDNTKLAVIKYTPEGKLISGYVSDLSKLVYVRFYINGGFRSSCAYYPSIKSDLIYSNYRGEWLCKVNVPPSDLLRETMVMGQGGFPYHFDRNYEAVDNFALFKGKQKVLRRSSYKFSKHLKYSFGLEFETSQGYIPEEMCFRDGLIPLRDGSISGLEYSTVVLEGNKGLCLLEQQLKTLKKYTTFNKECSLHIHFGGFPLEPDALYRVYYLFKKLENSISEIIPDLTFRTDLYKKSQKNYCKRLPIFKSFNDLYEHLVGRPYLGNLTQPHPSDLSRKRKWNISTRYYNLNFINAFCYDVNKTIEFRFLRPTFNFNKILLWMYIFNAILKYAEEHEDILSFPNNISSLLYEIYPREIADALSEGIDKLNILKVIQDRNGDNCGNDVYLEDNLFKGKILY